MHGNAYSTKGRITVIPPYRPGGYEFGRTSLPVKEDIKRCVGAMLKQMGEENPDVWWLKYPFTISVRDSLDRGSYVYRVDKS